MRFSIVRLPQRPRTCSPASYDLPLGLRIGIGREVVLMCLTRPQTAFWQPFFLRPLAFPSFQATLGTSLQFSSRRAAGSRWTNRTLRRSIPSHVPAIHRNAPGALCEFPGRGRGTGTDHCRAQHQSPLQNVDRARLSAQAHDDQMPHQQENRKSDRRYRRGNCAVPHRRFLRHRFRLYCA
jgi:hypothetical protein